MPDQFRFPFQTINGQLATVDQDSTADVVGQAHALLLTPPGYFTRQPDLGLNDQAHRQGGPDVAEVQRQLDLYVPDAASVTEEDASRLGELPSVGAINVRVRPS
jgi:hypothetical protein